MKKLLILQVAGCALAWLIGRWAAYSTTEIALFGWIPIFLTGYGLLWWFRRVFFFRDPQRVVPPGDNLVLSPADGRVMYVYPVNGGEVTSNKQGERIPITELAKTDIRDAKGWLVGIYMTPFDVHFNRAPVDGPIRTVHYHRTGANLPMVDLWEYVRFTLLRKAVDLFTARFHLENERMTMRIDNDRVACVLILIADRFVNKITRFFDDGQFIGRGQKIAFIERGSQTDLFIAREHISFRVRPGDQVYAGHTVIATLEE